MVFSIPRQALGQLWPFSSSPGIHTPFSTACFCDPPGKSLPLENLHFLTDVTTITTAISTAKYRAEFLCLRYYFMRTDEFVTTNLWSVCWAPLNIQQLFFHYFWGFFFFFHSSLKIVFCNTEPYFLPLLKETQRFFRPCPQGQTSPRPLLVLIFFRSPFQHGSQAQARSRELKGKGHQGSQKCSHTLSRGTWGRENKTIEHREGFKVLHTHTRT